MSCIQASVSLHLCLKTRLTRCSLTAQGSDNYSLWANAFLFLLFGFARRRSASADKIQTRKGCRPKERSSDDLHFLFRRSVCQLVLFSLLLIKREPAGRFFKEEKKTSLRSHHDRLTTSFSFIVFFHYSLSREERKQL